MHNHLKSVLPITGHEIFLTDLNNSELYQLRMPKVLLKSLLNDRNFIYSIKEINTDHKGNTTEIIINHLGHGYEPKFLKWCKSYWEEVLTFREIISGKPSDLKSLKDEYQQLTGVRYQEIR